MGLFGNSKELLFRTDALMVTQASPENKGEEGSFIEERREFREAVVNKKSTGGNWEFEV